MALLEAGTRLGHYEILSSLGAGGMGEVYRAKDTKLGREVAIKLLLEAVSADPDRLARFEREARVLASLNHNNIATLHGFEKEGDTSFLVMEVVEGETLADRIKRGAISIDEALPLFLQIAEGLEAAHEKGVIHRDLKPANIKVTDDGNVKILDFGLAKAMGSGLLGGEPAGATHSPTLTMAATQRGEILGTAAYMSPEQAKGAAIDKRTDIWAFGACLYETLTGARAFAGDTATETLGKLLEREPDWQALPAETPPHLVALMKRCLKKEPALRLRDIGDAWVAMLEPGGDASTSAQPSQPADRWRLPALVGAAALVVGLAAGFLLAPSSPDAARLTGASAGRFTLPLAPDVPVATDFAGDVLFIAISPDGQRFVYVGKDDARTSRLYTRTLDELDFVPIAGTENGWQPFFSPDSQWIAFFTPVGELKKVSVSGGRPLTLLEGLASAQWAFGTWGDDDRIVFTTFTSGLHRIGSDGSNLEILTAPEDGWHDRPVSLPGSTTILYQQRTAPQRQRIVARSLVDGDEKVIVEDAGEPIYLTSGYLLFRRRESVLAVSFDPERLELTGQAVPLDLSVRMGRPPYPTATTQLKISNTGTLFYLPARDEADLQETLSWVSHQGVIEEIWSSSENVNYRLSPAADRTAFTSWQAGRTLVGVLDLERGIPTQLAEVPSNISTNLIWSKDGSEVFFGSSLTTEGVLYRKAVDSSEPPEPLLRVPSYWGASPWSLGPSGEIAYTTWHRDNETDIHFYSPDEGKELPTNLNTSVSERQPTFSPDGRWLAYQSDESGVFEIYVMEYPSGAQKRRVSSGGGNGPLWSPDGRQLFFHNRSGRRFFGLDVKFEPELILGEPRLLFEGPFVASGDTKHSFDISPDGGRFMMVIAPETRESGVQPVVVLDWFPELLRQVPVD